MGEIGLQPKIQTHGKFSWK